MTAATTTHSVDSGASEWEADHPQSHPVDAFAPTEPCMEQSDNSGFTNLRAGSSVEVRGRFEQTWHPGYRVERVTDQGIELRRDSDGSVLPTFFSPTEVRKRRSRSTWWT